MNRMVRHIARGARLILAAVFIFSSLTKAIDPVGTQLKIAEYFSAFGLEFISGAAIVLAFTLIAVEFLLGALLLFEVANRFTSKVLLVFMSLFTLLTLFIAITNPVSDCGCFGDVVKLSNRATLIKNIILLVVSAILWLIERHTEHHTSVKSIVAVAVFLGIVLWAAFFSYRNLPLIETTPFGAGVNIPEAMAVPDDAQPDIYTTELHYRDRATGKVHIFSEQDTTWWDDSKWEFVKTNPILVQKGFRPAIENFKLFGAEGDLTDSLLREPALMLFVIRDPSAINDNILGRLYSAREFAAKNNLRFALLTSHPQVESQIISDIAVVRADATMLKTLLRSRAGVVLLTNGQIVAKWSSANMPQFSTYKGNLIKKAESYAAQREVFPYILLVGFVILIVLSYRYLNR